MYTIGHLCVFFIKLSVHLFSLFNGIVCILLLLSFTRFIYILDMNTFSGIWYINIFIPGLNVSKIIIILLCQRFLIWFNLLCLCCFQFISWDSFNLEEWREDKEPSKICETQKSRRKIKITFLLNLLWYILPLDNICHDDNFDGNDCSLTQSSVLSLSATMANKLLFVLHSSKLPLFRLVKCYKEQWTMLSL